MKKKIEFHLNNIVNIGKDDELVAISFYSHGGVSYKQFALMFILRAAVFVSIYRSFMRYFAREFLNRMRNFQNFFHGPK